MSASKVNFLRNLTPVYMLWPVFIAMGTIYFYKLMTKLIHPRGQMTKPTVQAIGLLLTSSLLMLTLPYDVAADFVSPKVDSRRQAMDWVMQNIRQQSTLVIVDDIGIDTRPLRNQYRIVKLPNKQLNLDYLSAHYFKPDHYFLIPDYGLHPFQEQAALLQGRQKRRLGVQACLVELAGAVQKRADLFLEPRPDRFGPAARIRLRAIGEIGDRRDMARENGAQGFALADPRDHKRVERIWRREGLKVPRRQSKRGRLWLNDGSCVRRRPERRNHVWAYDFCADRTHEGRPVRLLVVVDEFTRECLSIDVARKLTSEDVRDRLTELFVRRGVPEHIRSDSGPEFTAKRVRD